MIMLRDKFTPRQQNNAFKRLLIKAMQAERKQPLLDAAHVALCARIVLKPAH